MRRSAFFGSRHGTNQGPAPAGDHPPRIPAKLSKGVWYAALGYNGYEQTASRSGDFGGKTEAEKSCCSLANVGVELLTFRARAGMTGSESRTLGKGYESVDETSRWLAD